MSLDAVYADDIEANLQRWAANPPAPEEESFSMRSFIGAGLKGIPAAVLEVSGGAVDATSGYGNVMAATGGTGRGMFSTPTEDERKQETQARERMLAGENQNVAIGNVLRKEAAAFAPDPITANHADQVIFGLTRFAGKAVGYVGTMGPAGAIPLGLEEGNTETQKLRQKGIDDETAIKAGAVQGVGSAIGAVLPIGGKTALQTLGLVAVGGPGMFMAQEATSREILARAGYKDEASLHNPFDPLGLGLSLVVPGAFGALHMRGVAARAGDMAAGKTPLAQMSGDELRGLKYNDARLDAFTVQVAEASGVPPAILLGIKNAGEKSGPTAKSPAGAVGVMQFMEPTAKEMGLKDRTDPLESIQAGAAYLKKLHDAYGSWDAAIAHYNGGGAQAAIVRGGGKPTIKETAAYLERVQQFAAEHTVEAGSKVPEVVDAARVSVLNDAVQRSLPDVPDAYARVMRAADIVGESGGRAAEAATPPVHVTELPQFREWFGSSKIVDENGRPAVMYHGTGNDVAAFEPLRPGPHTKMGATFLTADPAVASHYANVGAMFGDKAPNIVPVYAKAERPFDYADAAQRAAVVDRVMETAETYTMGDGRKALMLDGKKTLYSKDVLDAGLAEGRNWELIERPVVQDAIKHLGHDGFWINEDTRNLAVYDGTQLKSAIGNSGKFDPNSPSLTDPLQAGEQAIRWRESSNALPSADSVSVAGDQLAKRGAEVGAQERPEGAGGAGATAPEAFVDQAIAKKLAAEQPDLLVTLPGTEERITVAEALKRIAEEQKQDGHWADLVKVAAECALGA